MKRKIVYLLVAILLIGALCTLLTACNNDNDDTDSITLMVYQPANDSAKNTYEEMIKEFTKESGVKVKIRFVPKDEYNTKLKTNFKTPKNKPDVFYLDQPMLADYADLCLNLNTGFYAAEGEEGLHVSDFFDVAMDTVKYNGDILAVPFSLTTSVLLYNTKLVSSVPKSWDEWRNMAVPDGKALFGGIGTGGYASWYFQAFLKSAGGDMISADNKVIFNNAQGVAAAEMVRNLYKKSSKNIRESANAFTNGNVMFTLAHNSDIFNAYTNNPTFFENDLGATLFIPQNEGGASYSNIGGENFAIYKDSKNIDACKQLVNFLLREENVDKAISTNFSAIKAYAKVRETDVTTGAVYSAKFKQVMGVVLQQLDYASARPQVKNWMKVNDDYLSTALSEILDDNKANIQTCLDRAQNQATKVLDFD